VGERQTQRLRERYVKAVLSQEIAWFDCFGANELATKVAELCGKVQDGLGRKVGDLIQYSTQVVASLVIGFYLCWKLTLVLLCTFPVLAVTGKATAAKATFIRALRSHPSTYFSTV
jgi:ATP-binding cassette subfamily B (MDR/TAP) protein 1